MIATPSPLILTAHGKAGNVSIRRFLGRLVAEGVRQSDPTRLGPPMPPATDVNVLTFDTAALAALQALADAITNALAALPQTAFQTADLPIDGAGNVKAAIIAPDQLEVVVTNQPALTLTGAGELNVHTDAANSSVAVSNLPSFNFDGNGNLKVVIA